MADSIIGKISVGDGATFTPDVTDGVLSFTNNKNLPNPEPYNIAAKVLDEGENELRTLVTAAETAAGNAATSETNAHNSEQAAKASETAAATSASAAKTSETNAASSETAAATSATNAATSETNASNSASAAATSESNASDSATAAAASAAEVEAALDDYLPLSGGTVTGDLTVEGTITGTNLTATTVKAGTLTADALNGPLTGNVTGTADKAVADGSGNNIVNTYVTKSALASSVTTATGKVTTLTATDSTLTNATITGTTSVPTANAGNSSKAIANTEFVQGELTNYLPLSGGTLTGVVNGVTPTAGDNSTKLATTEFVNAKAGGGTPTGVVQAFAGSTTPQGWLLCDGSAVSRTTYAALFSVIGTTYGTGNGSTTFNLPNLTDRFIQGNGTVGTKKDAGLPNITGAVRPIWNGSEGVKPSMEGSGAFAPEITASYIDYYIPKNSYDRTIGSNINSYTANFNASRSSKIYGKSSTVQPPALTMQYIIKY